MAVDNGSGIDDRLMMALIQVIDVVKLVMEAMVAVEAGNMSK